ncbi:ribonuclease III, partial [gut metagenome]
LIEQFLDQDNNPIFHTEIRVEGLSAGTGTGYSKKESQQNAAQMALKKIKEDEAFKQEIIQLKEAHQAITDTNNEYTTEEIEKMAESETSSDSAETKEIIL